MDSFNEGWNIVCNYIKEENKMSEIAYNTWIQRIVPKNIDYEKNEITLQVPNELHKKTLMHGYISVLEDAYEVIFGTKFNTVFITENENIETEPVRQNPYFTGKDSANAGYEFTFDTFIVGSSNKFAHAACLAVAQNPAQAYNPLFLYGNSGLGKTHLLYAIGNDIKKNNPSFDVIYIKSEDFTNEIVQAILNKETQKLRDKYRKADVLLVDDVQFIGGKDAVQTEFFHTFDALYDAHKQIVLTSDRPPKEIKNLTDRIKSRFEEGLIADIQPPDLETRIAIIERKSQLIGLNLPNDVCEHIAKKLKTNIRQLEGIVKKLNAKYLLTKEMPTISSVNESIAELINNDIPPKLTVEKIVDEVARTYGVTAEEIRNQKSRRAEINKPRQIAIYIVRELTNLSMENIGKEFGGRHYSTIVYIDKQVREQLKTDEELRDTVEDIIKNIRDRQ